MANPRSAAAAVTAATASVGSAGDDRPAARRRVGWLVVAIPAVVELVVGGYRISGPSFWRDEGYTIAGAQRPVSAIFRLVQHEDAFHGLYLLLMHPIIANFGRSEMALRVPSLIAMSAAVGLTAALGRRLARASGLQYAPGVGLIAGLFLAGLPVTTRYAQEGRPYGLVAFFAVLTTYVLVVAVGRTGWRWWVLYGVALLVTTLFDLVAVLLAGAHGISLLVGRSRAKAGGVDVPGEAARFSARVLKRWFTACVATAILLSPVLAFSFGQSSQLDWVQPPNLNTLVGLLHDFAGATPLIYVVGVLAVLGCIAGPGLRRGRGLTLAAVCLPWWFLPPALLLLVSLLHPVYVDRYILFSVPALAILVSAGLVWTVSVVRRWLPSRVSARRARALSLVPLAAVAVTMVVLLIGPQVAIRQPSSRADDIRTVARVLATFERPGDAILYLPRKAAVISRAYPAPFDKLRDLDLLIGPIPSGTLLGVPAGPRVVAARLRGVQRVWTLEWVHPLAPDSVPPLNLVRLLAPMHMVASWQIKSVLLVLYAAPSR